MKLVVEVGQTSLVFTSAKLKENIIHMKKTSKGKTVNYTLNTQNMTLRNENKNKSQTVSDWYIDIDEESIRRRNQLLSGVFSPSEEDLLNPATKNPKIDWVLRHIQNHKEGTPKKVANGLKNDDFAPTY